MELNSPASAADIAAVESALGRRLPDAYRMFLSTHDGGEGELGESYLVLWRARELLAFNEDYEVSTYAPGLFFFGSNGGGEGFAFDLRDAAAPIMVVPFIGLSHRDARFVAADFDGFLVRLEQHGVFDPGDEEDRARLHARLDSAWKSARAGNVTDAALVLAKLRPPK